MNILMLHNRYQIPGGEDVSTEMQVELLRSGGHTVDLVEDHNERVDALGKVKTAIRTQWSSAAYHDISHRLEDGAYDLMHVQNFFPLFSPSVHHAAASMGVPTVQSLRNFRLVCPQGMLYRDGRVCTDCVGRSFALPAVRHSCYRDSRAGSIVVGAMSLGHKVSGTWATKIDRYVTPSAYAAEMHVQGGWDPDSIEVIPNFVHPDPGPGTGDGGFVLYAGRLAPSKGIDLLLEAWRTSLTDVPLRIAGDGDLRPQVESAAADLDAVTYLGSVSSTEAMDLMGEAACVVAPTVGIETFGRVAAEALAKGTPSIAADHGGLADIVDDGVTGLLVPPGDVTAFAAAVRRLWDDPERTAAMRPAARARYVEHYSSDTALTRWEDLYRDVIDRAS